MKKILDRVKSSPIVKNDGKNFLHFFLAFTIIFVALTIIILQVMTSGIYKSTDQNLHDLAKNPNFLKDNMLGPTSQGDYGPTNSIIYYNADGQIILPIIQEGTNHQQSNNPVTGTSGNNGMNYVMAQLEKAVKLDKHSLGQIRSISVENTSGANWHYRYLTVGLKDSSGKIELYIQIFSNVDQLQDSLSRNTLIIITTMISFWLLSVFISLFLANWTLRPIMSAYEKQKAFVENASHELRTPLAILQNRLELLFQNPTATIIDESENISESLSEVRNMRLLTTNLLNLARRDNGIKIEAEETDASFFEAIFNNYQILAEDAEKILNSSVTLEGKINLDQSLVKQLLTILYDNAVKYTGEHGVITIDVHRAGDFLVLSVADNGEGISDEDKKRIFDRFYRVDKARTRQKGGLGLGLSLARQIAEAYNGRILVEDNQPQGTKFTARLKIGNSIANRAKVFQKL